MSYLALALALAVLGGDAQTAEAEARRALQLYRAERYVEAARHFLRAYDLSENPTQLRNAAKALEKGEYLRQALAHWEQYQTLDVPEDKRAEAKAAIARIQAAIAARAPPELPPPAPPPPAVTTAPPPDAGGAGIFGWTLVGTGAAAFVTSLALYLSGWSTYWTYQAGIEDGTQEVTRADADAAELRSGIGLGVGIAGLLAAGGGLLLLAAD